MSEFERTSLQIVGYGSQPLPNRFLRSPESTKHKKALVVLFPGLYYSCDMPLLYFTSSLALARGMDVLQVQRDYAQPEYQAAHRLEQLQWLGQDAQAALAAAQSGYDYSQLILVGKSIGTLVLAYLAPGLDHPSILAVWLTPLLNQPLLVDSVCSSQLPSLLAAGTGDRLYDPPAIERLRAATQVEMLLFPDADHSLEIPGNPLRSISILNEYLQGLSAFLDRYPPGVH